MTLKEELLSLYSESKEARKQDFLNNKLPGRMREAAKNGKTSILITSSDIKESGASFYIFEKWCADNGFERSYRVDPYAGPFLVIYLV